MPAGQGLYQLNFIPGLPGEILKYPSWTCPPTHSPVKVRCTWVLFLSEALEDWDCCHMKARQLWVTGHPVTTWWQCFSLVLVAMLSYPQERTYFLPLCCCVCLPTATYLSREFRFLQGFMGKSLPFSRTSWQGQKQIVSS